MLATVLSSQASSLRCVLACWVLTSALGCASSPPPKPAKAPAPKPVAVAEPPPPPPAPTKVKIKGLTGTLNKDDVDQTMEARKNALDDCILQSRRRLRWVNGTIHFAFKVDEHGVVTDVHPTESDIGHYDLETCITQVLAQTTFPEPDGDATAQFEWSLSVDAATPHVPDPTEPDFLDRVLRKNVPKILELCEVHRREHFNVTAYITRRGKVVSCGAVSRPAEAAEKAACVLDELKKLKMPKSKKDAKVSFDLK